MDEETPPGEEDIRGQSSARPDNPTNGDDASTLENPPPAESNPRSLPCSDGSEDRSSVPESLQQSAETESCLSLGATIGDDRARRSSPT
jgi:hypothetical protein